jgi:hypothetical protein
MLDDRQNEPDFINKKETDLYGTGHALPPIKTHPLSGTSFKLRTPISKSGVMENMTQKPKNSFAKKFFVMSLIVLLLAALYTTYRIFFSESRQDFVSRHIDINITTAPFTRGGESLPVTVSVVNRNNIALVGVKAEIEYPRGSQEESRDDFERQIIELGDIPSGAESTKNINVVLYGEQGSSKKIKVTIDYGLSDSNLTYTKIGESSLTISSSPILLEVDAPKDIAPGQLYTLRVRATQNIKTLPAGALLNIAIPRDFTLETVSKPATYGVGTWLIDTEKEGDYDDITLTGRFSSQEGDERSFRFTVGVPLENDQTSIKTSYVSKTHVVTLARPMLDIYILLGTEKAKTIAVNPDSYVQGTLVYRNRYNVAVIDPVFNIQIQGSALDESSILPLEGFYDSNNKKILWDKNTNPTLNRIAPGTEGRLSFTFRVLPKTIDGPTVVRDPSVNMMLSFTGLRDDGTMTTETLENIESANVRVTTEPVIDVETIHATGSLPPKVGLESTYQISFSVQNTHNEITGARFVAKIPFYVKWVGKVTKNEKVTYNPDTREVVWTLGNVSAGAGSLAPIRTAEIQLSITPSLSQIDSSPELLQNIRFTGTDLFSNKDVKASHSNTTTRITNGTSRDAVVVQ